MERGKQCDGESTGQVQVPSQVSCLREFISRECVGNLVLLARHMKNSDTSIGLET
jgi:hypothetical protein